MIKTLFVLNYIDDEAYRRRILTQLNRGEGRNKLARVVFYGQRGELRQRYREGQENQLTALGLVVNAIIVWNTLYLERALDALFPLMTARTGVSCGKATAPRAPATAAPAPR